jgi:predicted RecB family nuclease
MKKRSSPEEWSSRFAELDCISILSAGLTHHRMTPKGTLRICPKGHRYYKSSDCPTCPKCEELKKPTDGFLGGLSAPAQRALTGAGIKTVKQLANYSEKDILALHGIGPSAIPKLKAALKNAKLSFRK